MLILNSKPDVFISPTTFNDEVIVVILFNVVFPETFNDDIHVVTLFNFVCLEIFKSPVIFTPVVFIEKYSGVLIGSS